MKDKAGQLKVGVQFAEAEGPVVIHGYSVKQPAISVEGGQHGDMQFDSGTGYFSVQVSPAANAPFDKSSGDPVRKITVSLETRTK
jgi:hypothetical protein